VAFFFCPGLNPEDPGSGFPELEGSQIIGAFELGGIRAIFVAEDSAHLFHRLVFVFIHPGFETFDEGEECSGSIPENCGNHLDGISPGHDSFYRIRGLVNSTAKNQGERKFAVKNGQPAQAEEQFG
jgi:hypothetical protein